MQRALAYSVLRQQPLRVAGDIAGDSVKIFALTRNTEEGDTPISRWQFQFGYPYYPPGVTRHGCNSVNRVFAQAGGGGPARVHWKADIALRYYQLHGGYTPGPVFLLGLLAGIGRDLHLPAAPGSGPRAGLRADHRVRGRRAAGRGPVRVLLALPAARAGHAARRGGVRGDRAGPAHPGAAARAEVSTAVPARPVRELAIAGSGHLPEQVPGQVS